MTRALCFVVLSGASLAPAVAADSAPPDIARAENLYRDGKYKESIDLLTKVADANHAMAISPNSPYNLGLRCRVYVTAQRYDDAMTDCNNAIAIDANDETAYFYRGRVEIAQQQSAKAIADYTTVLKLDSDETGAYYWRAVANLDSGAFADALKDVDAYIQATPTRSYYARESRTS